MPRQNNTLLGVGFLMLGLFIVPFNDAVAKALSTDLNIMEIIWSRFFGHFLLLVPLVFYFKGKKEFINKNTCLLYTSPSPRDRQKSRMPSSA